MRNADSWFTVASSRRILFVVTHIAEPLKPSLLYTQSSFPVMNMNLVSQLFMPCLLLCDFWGNRETKKSGVGLSEDTLPIL